jgi:hypothetical protein
MKDGDFLGRWYFRYGVGTLFLLISFSMATSGVKDPLPATIFFGILGLICMKEVALWCIGLSILGGIAWFIIGAIAAIPISIAIIIGAYIIANSFEK